MVQPLTASLKLDSSEWASMDTELFPLLPAVVDRHWIVVLTRTLAVLLPRASKHDIGVVLGYVHLVVRVTETENFGRQVNDRIAALGDPLVPVLSKRCVDVVCPCGISNSRQGERARGNFYGIAIQARKVCGHELGDGATERVAHQQHLLCSSFDLILDDRIDGRQNVLEDAIDPSVDFDTSRVGKERLVGRHEGVVLYIAGGRFRSLVYASDRKDDRLAGCCDIVCFVSGSPSGPSNVLVLLTQWSSIVVTSLVQDLEVALAVFSTVPIRNSVGVAVYSTARSATTYPQSTHATNCAQYFQSLMAPMSVMFATGPLVDLLVNLSTSPALRRASEAVSSVAEVRLLFK